MDKKEVINFIGSTSYKETSNLNTLCTLNKWQGCQSALASNSTTFITWPVGIDTFMVVGFNAKNKLIYKAFGDT